MMRITCVGRQNCWKLECASDTSDDEDFRRKLGLMRVGQPGGRSQLEAQATAFQSEATEVISLGTSSDDR
jgi:hypothetical protein